jgi:hypothetical protein
MSLFTPDGGFVRSWRPYLPGSEDESLVSVAGALEDGTLLLSPRMRMKSVDRYPSLLPLLRFKSDADVVDTLAVLSTRNQILAIRYRDWISFTYQPFADGTLWNVSSSGDAIVLVNRAAASQSVGSYFQVTKLTSDGDTVFTRRFGYGPKRISKSEVNVIVSSLSESRARRFPSEDAANHAVLEALYLPEYHPPVTGALVGRDGTIWLRREMIASTDSVLWLVLDGAGNSLGEVQLSAGTRVAEADRLFVWGIETTSLGVPYVVRYRLVASRGNR